ncbi:DUF4434 domain-containing protein [Parabacteroides bouchesdurhonensis]|uniref:DUF4434 domain-containing protein n=1 Tax=Parabacteroides bouchesdurhonensis TaxID=1936995 RepID=UPI000E467297|nr:DUF4434 domain-containing protein [Parabacteroides bouchesdurhonensis]RHJ94207.1 DUF4434 domain-containing protein [Bacteroides sp. AM07-16]
MNLLGKAITLFMLLSLCSIQTIKPGTTKPIRGTWLNLTYQDVRNKYMNPAHIDNTNPALWRQKVKELSGMGVNYLVILAVANEGKAFYPSNFMLPAYPADRESPVEAIMNAADENNMQVFMSCGWAQNQDDDLRKPEIRRKQIQIMEEVAGKFGNHKSFYGWYLPVEDAVNPYFPEHAVDAVNTLTAEARRCKPDAVVMISPYGIRLSNVDDPKFAEQIAKVKVDIIAFQDEIGCVPETLPLPLMKENFRKLCDIHKKAGIRFWANNESFTWEKGTNSRESALIPAAFPRFLSQMTGVTKAGAEEILSFAMYGIYDKPNSEMPIGQPCLSAKAYKDYMDWKAGKGRWPLLEATFTNDLPHDAIGKPVVFATPPNSKYNKGNLTDKRLGDEDFKNTNWLGFKDKDMEATLDLGGITNINTLAIRFLNYLPKSIALPNMVDFYISNDGISYKKAKTVAMETSPNNLHDCWIDIAVADGLNTQARYIKIVAENQKGNWLFTDEIMVNPQK